MNRNNGVRTDLVKLWRKNIRLILMKLGETETRLAEKCGITRQSMSNMLTRSDNRLTSFQFLGSMYAMEMLILEHKFNREVWELWNEVHREYCTNGLSKEGI